MYNNPTTYAGKEETLQNIAIDYITVAEKARFNPSSVGSRVSYRNLGKPE